MLAVRCYDRFSPSGAGKLFHPGDPAFFDPASWSEPRCLPNASNPGALPWARQGAKGREGFPYYGQGQCPYDQHNPSLNPPPGWGCPVNVSMEESFCNNRTHPRRMTCFPDLLTLGTALDFLRTGAAGFKVSHKGSPSTPFWLGVGFTKPHYPQIYPAAMAALVPKAADIDLPPNRNFTMGGVPMAWMSEIDGGGIDLHASDAVTRTARQSYYAAAAFSDSLLGELLHELDVLGVAQDTVVAITADHGWGLGEHNHFSKYTNWETDARVPMLVRAPWKAAARGQRTSALVEHVDLYPSLAELAGVPVDPAVESIDGQSWAGLLDDPSGASGQHTKLAAYSQYPRCWPSRNPTHTPADYDRMERCLPNTGWDNGNMSFMGLSMRTKDYRYTEWHAWKGGQLLRPDWNDRSQMIELYDHRADPPHSSKVSFEQFENVNVAHAPANRALVQQLGQQLRTFFQNERKPEPAPPAPPAPAPLPPPRPTPSCPVVNVDCYWDGSAANPASVSAASWAECCASCGAERGCKKWVFRGAQPSGGNCNLHSANATAHPAGSGSGVVCGELDVGRL